MVKRGLKIYMTFGSKGSGKSLSFARDTLKITKQIERAHKRYPQLPLRIIYTNQKLSESFEKDRLNKLLFYWEDARELRYCPRIHCFKTTDRHPTHDCDILWDEIGKDFPAGSWVDTPRWLRQIFSHCRKRGNRIFANTQIYEDTDIAFRRQIDHAEEVTKVFGTRDISATRPPPKFPFALIVRRSRDPRILEFEHDPIQREAKEEWVKKIYWDIAIPRPLFSALFNMPKLVKLYDTQSELPPSKPLEVDHTELYCENPDCKLHGRNTGKPLIKHKAI